MAAGGRGMNRTGQHYLIEGGLLATLQRNMLKTQERQQIINLTGGYLYFLCYFLIDSCYWMEVNVYKFFTVSFLYCQIFDISIQIYQEKLI